MATLSNKIVLVTPSRFASVNLAEYLQTIGRLEALYTGYPQFKLRELKVDSARIRTFPWLVVPYMALNRVSGFPQRLRRELGWRGQDMVDAFAARTLPDCGLVSAMSASGLRAGTEIKRRGGAYVCERGSTHILWQKRILEEEYGSLGLYWIGIHTRVIEKELAEYELADRITLGSSFSVRSFVEMGLPAGKLRLTPYGVSIGIFRRSAPRAKEFRVLFVGQPSVRKGLHYLLQAFERARLPGSELIMVGGTAPDRDALLARYPVKNLKILGFLPLERMVEEISRANVLVVPSIEEGLAAVQAQAMACGCPVIATTNAGAEDLFEDGKEGFIVQPRNIDVLVERMTRLYRDRALVEAMGSAALARARGIGGWDKYGRLMTAVFDELLAAKSAGKERAGQPAEVRT